MSFKNSQTEKFKYRHKCLFPKAAYGTLHKSNKAHKVYLKQHPSLTRPSELTLGTKTSNCPSEHMARVRCWCQSTDYPLKCPRARSQAILLPAGLVGRAGSSRGFLSKAEQM